MLSSLKKPRSFSLNGILLGLGYRTCINFLTYKTLPLENIIGIFIAAGLKIFVVIGLEFLASDLYVHPGPNETFEYSTDFASDFSVIAADTQSRKRYELKFQEASKPSQPIKEVYLDKLKKAIKESPRTDYKLADDCKVELRVYADKQRNELLRPDQNFPGMTFYFELVITKSAGPVGSNTSSTLALGLLSPLQKHPHDPKETAQLGEK